MILPKVRIKEMAKSIADGATCYINRRSFEISIIEPFDESDPEYDKHVEFLELVERKPENYFVFEELEHQYLLDCMRDYLNETMDNELNKELNNSLNRKNPTRNFLQIVTSREILEIQWKNFKVDWHTEWIAEKMIDAYNY